MRNLLFIMLISFSAILIAEEDQDRHQQELDCNEPVTTGQSAVKETLGPLYANGADIPQLRTAADRVGKFITDATYCRLSLQSGAEKAPRETVAEWSSLHQWLNRLADMLEASAAASASEAWKDEYLLFAEVYEFEP